MKKSWGKRLEEIMSEIHTFKSESMDNYIVFRGQSNYKWHLTPSLYVAKNLCKWDSDELEQKEYNIYFDFVTNATGYIDNSMQPWEILCEMRHFGLPVRVLDWSENFNAALYFAVIDSKIRQSFN